MLLEPGVTNLNTGSFGPLSRDVFDQVTALRQRLAAEPMDFLVRQTPLLLWKARAHLARFIGCDPRRLIFTVNVTAAVNMVAASLCLAAPGEILLTDHEYGAMHWCWERAAQRLGLALRTFPLPLTPEHPDAIVGAMRHALTERTRLVFFSHILSPTGLVLPVRELCALARQHGVITVVDGAHAPAMIDLDVESLACNFYGANCHKWLLAPTGTGFLYLGKASEDRLKPLQVSWGWHHDHTGLDDRDEHGSTPRLRALEFEGTRDPCPWLAVPAAIEFLEGLGLGPVRQRIAELAAHVRRRLMRINGLTLQTPADPRLHGAMTAFRLQSGIDTVALRKVLWEQHRIEVNLFDRSEGPLLRVSTHFYNTEQEIDQLADALPSALALAGASRRSERN
jgi:isopenicillin-N epimerase